jgi:hypothetical protein
VQHWPQQDWPLAGRLAGYVLDRRQDLGWAATIHGWWKEKQGDLTSACSVYAAGLHASSFADQAVRFNTHAESEEHGKFSAARLRALRNYWDESLHDNAYLKVFVGPRERSLLVEVSEYWKQRAQSSEHQGDFARAYEEYFAWGWDLGVSRLADYTEILSSLQHCADRAGWKARALVAETHLRCLKRTSH